MSSLWRLSFWFMRWPSWSTCHHCSLFSSSVWLWITISSWKQIFYSDDWLRRIQRRWTLSKTSWLNWPLWSGLSFSSFSDFTPAYLTFARSWQSSLLAGDFHIHLLAPCIIFYNRSACANHAPCLFLPREGFGYNPPLFSIPSAMLLPFMNVGVVTQTIFITILVMTLGNMLYQKKALSTGSEAKDIRWKPSFRNISTRQRTSLSKIWLVNHVKFWTFLLLLWYVGGYTIFSWNL